MTEAINYIPNRVRNAAVGGHVCGSVDIIDDDLGLEQHEINKEIAGAVPYNQSTPNGMGRIVLKKNDNFKQVVEAQTNGNTIFVIKYDFTLTDNVTIPANCVLEFEGGSISAGSDENMNTITGNNTTIAGNVSLNTLLNGTFSNDWFKSSWFPNKTIHQIADICRNFKYLEIDTPYTLSSVLDLTDIFNIKMDKGYIATSATNYLKMGSTDGVGYLCRCNISSAGHIKIIGGYNLEFNIGYCDSLILEPDGKNIGYSHFYLGTIIDFAIEANDKWVNSNIFNCARIVSSITLRSSNKSVSANIFNDCVLECITMNFVKASSNRFYNTRLEGTSSAPNNITFDENCFDNVVEGLQKNGAIWSIVGDVLPNTNVVNNGFDSNVVRPAPDNYNRTDYYFTSNILDIHPLVGISKGNGGSFVSNGQRHIVDIHINGLNNTDFGFNTGCDANGGMVLYDVYLYDKYGNLLTATDVPIDLTLQSNIKWDGDHLHSTNSAYMHAFCLILSHNATGAFVASAEIRISITYNKTIEFLNLQVCTTKSSPAKIAVEIASPKYGADRPVVTDANIGFSMFDTTINSGNGGLIFYKGNNVWVDATGTQV